MEGPCGARPRRGRDVCLRRDVDGHLLPPQLPEPAAAGRSRPLFRHDDRGAAGGISRLQTLPSRHGWPRAAGCRGGPPALPPIWRRTPIETVTLGHLARVAAMSPHHLQRRFKAIVGLSPREYQAAVRADRLRASLRDGRDVTSAIYEAGYGSPSRVYEAAPTGKGMSLSNYRRQRRGHAHRLFDRAEPDRPVLVAATGNGVCSVKIGDSDASADPATCGANTRRPTCRPRIEAAHGMGEGDHASTCAATSRRSTCRSTCRPRPFSGRCGARCSGFRTAKPARMPRWRRTIGKPKAARAVARACATQSGLPGRSLPSGGARNGRRTGGYRWGKERKEALARDGSKQRRARRLRSRRSVRTVAPPCGTLCTLVHPDGHVSI